MKPDLRTIAAAQKFLAAYFPPTPLQHAPCISRRGADTFLKLEIALPTGSFKPRGALYALATNLGKRNVSEVTAASTGNHGAAVSWAAKILGVAATIFLPAHPHPVKRQKIADLGARIVEARGRDLTHAFLEAQKYSTRPGVYFLNDATDPDLPAGPATIGLEILSQLPQVAAIYVPMGDTALIRGLGAAVKQTRANVKLIGVQAERAPAYYLSWKKGQPVPTDACDTCADGLATRTPEPENVQAIRALVDDVILVTEEELIGAVRGLYELQNIVAEPAGAAATAAFLKLPYATGRVALLVTGGNISSTIRRRAGLPAI
jgi:threonine dehydratase